MKFLCEMLVAKYIRDFWNLNRIACNILNEIPDISELFWQKGKFSNRLLNKNYLNSPRQSSNFSHSQLHNHNFRLETIEYHKKVKAHTQKTNLLQHKKNL